MPCGTSCVVTEMNTRLALESPKTSATPDAGGHVNMDLSASWTNRGQRWAKVTTRGGSEGYRFNQVKAEVSHIVEMRWDSLTRTIGPTWRLKIGTRVLNVTAAVDVDEQRQVMRIDCTEEV